MNNLSIEQRALYTQNKSSTLSGTAYTVDVPIIESRWEYDARSKLNRKSAGLKGRTTRNGSANLIRQGEGLEVTATRKVRDRERLKCDEKRLNNTIPCDRRAAERKYRNWWGVTRQALDHQWITGLAAAEMQFNIKYWCMESKMKQRIDQQRYSVTAEWFSTDDNESRAMGPKAKQVYIGHRRSL
jgi:hypothetical protein